AKRRAPSASNRTEQRMDLRAIFLAGAEMADPDQREAFVEDACGTNLALRKQVESLLRAHDRHRLPEEQTPSPCDSAASPETLAAPRCLGRLGPYRLLAVLGMGGMGVVYLAEDQQLGRKVAVKVLQQQAAASPGASERFLREARAAAGIESDYVV